MFSLLYLFMFYLYPSQLYIFVFSSKSCILYCCFSLWKEHTKYNYRKLSTNFSAWLDSSLNSIEIYLSHQPPPLSYPNDPTNTQAKTQLHASKVGYPLVPIAEKYGCTYDIPLVNFHFGCCKIWWLNDGDRNEIYT